MPAIARQSTTRKVLVFFMLVVFISTIMSPLAAFATDPTPPPSPEASPSEEATPEATPAPDPSEPAAPDPTPEPTAEPTAPPSEPPAPGDVLTFIVTFTSGDDAAQAALLDSVGANETAAVAPLRMRVVELPAAGFSSPVDALRASSLVERVDLDRTRAIEADPNDTAYPDQWALPKIGWDQLHGTVAPANSATVAILDTGVDATHPDLDGILVDGTSILSGSAWSSDPNGHGTWMAGIVAAETNNAYGMAGVGYAGVSVMPVVVLGADGTGQDSDIIAGVVYAADHGADVILMAFSNPGYSPALQAALDYAWAQGAVLVAATGNDGVDSVTYPAGDRGVIGVAASNQADELAAFSNAGPAAFMAAPGVDIQASDVGGLRTTVTGTSAAAAHVAGSAALLAAIDSSASNGTIVGRLARNADALASGSAGNGRLNLARAAGDTATDEVQPNGAGPLGNGGPVVGPYVAATRNFSVNNVSVTEGDSGTVNLNFTVNLAGGGPEPSPYTVQYATNSGTATGGASCLAGVDYITKSGTLSFLGNGNQTVTVLVCGDTLDEANEAFTLDLSNPTNANAPGGGASGDGTINDNDPTPTLSITDVSVLEGNSGTTTAAFLVTLSAASGRVVTVTYATQNVTAATPTDYTAIPNTVLTFNPGETAKTINVSVNGDVTIELDETFRVNLSSASNATIADGIGIGTIQNDDVANVAPVIDLNGAPAGINNTAGFTEDQASPTILAPDTLVTDANNANLASAAVTLTTRPDGALESLSATGASCPGITITPYNAATGLLAFTGSATLATYQACLRTVAYSNTSQNSNTTARSITWTVNDGTVNSATATTTLSVTAQDDAPVIDLDGPGAGIDNAATFSEDQVGATTLASGAVLSDVDNTNLASAAVTLTTRPDGALESLSVTGASCPGITITPYNPGTGLLAFSGPATIATYQACLRTVAYNNTDQDPSTTARSITWTVNDGTVNSAVATTTLSVTAQNDAPVCQDVTLSTDENTIGSTAPDCDDVEGDTLTYSVGPAGTGISGTDGTSTLTYDPDDQFESLDTGETDSDSFTYTANDGDVDSTAANVAVTINGINDAPVCQDVTLSTDENTIGSTAPDCDDVEGDTLTYSVGPAGTGISGTDGTSTLTYDPDDQFESLDTGETDSDSFTYTANDGDVDSTAANVAVTINGINDAPVCQDVTLSTDENTIGSTAPDCDDVEGDTLTYSVGPAGTGISGTDGTSTLTYDPDDQFESLDTGETDSDSFTYTANDGDVDSTAANVAVTINGINDAPVCQDVTLSTDENTIGSTAPDCDDVEGDTLTYSVGPAGTGISGTDGTSTLTYDPDDQFESLDTGETDSDSFTYTANDGDVDSTAANVAVTINGINDAPVCQDVTLSTDENTIGSTAPDCDDVEGDTLTYSVGPAGTGISGTDGTSTLTYDPDDQFESLDTGETDSDSFTYTANDGDVDSTAANVAVTINGINDAPVVTLDAGNDLDVNEGDSPTYDFAIFDAEGDPIDDVTVDCGANGSVVGTTMWDNDSGSFTCSFPDGDALSTISASATDDDGDTGAADTQIVTINNVAPTVVLDAGNDLDVNEGDSPTYTFAISDPGTDDVSAVTVDCGANGSEVGSASFDNDSGSFTCSFPDGDALSTISASATDDDGDTGAADTQIVTINNVAPTVVLDAGNDLDVNEGDSPTYTFAISDPGTDDVSAVTVDCGANGSEVGSASFDNDSGSFTCSFPDGDALSTISASATDDDGDTGAADTQIVTINNVAPTVVLDAGNDLDVNEGDSPTYTFAISDPGTDDVSAVTVDCGANGSEVGSASFDNDSGSFTCSFPDGDALSTISASATDDDGDTGAADTQIVTINNVAPTVVLDAGNDLDVNEGDSPTYTFAISDPGTDDVSAVTVDCGANGSEVGSASFDNDSGSFTCSFPDGDALSTISASATDDDGDTGAADTQIVTINNVAPTVVLDAGNDLDVNEGDSPTYTFAISDPGTDDVSAVTVDCGANGSEVGSASFDNDSGSFTCSFPDGDALSTISASATDDDGDTGAADTQIVTINNVAPTVVLDAGNDLDVNEGDSPTYTFAISDPGTDDVSAVTVDCGANGSEVGSASFDNDSGSFTCSFPDGDALSTISASATDDDGDTGAADTQIVTINNVAPTVVLDAGNDLDVNEGDSPTYTFAISDPGTDDVSAVTVDCGANGSEVGSASFDNDSGSFTCSFPDGDALSTISASATDDDGDTGAADTQIVTINNVAPTVVLDAGNDLDVNEGDSPTYTFAISDPGTDDVSAVTVDCGANGSEVGSASFDNDSGSFTCSFPDGDALSTISASATDDDGDTGAADTQIVTINNVAPTVVLDAGNDLDVNEGDSPTYTFAISDPGTDDVSAVTVDCGANGSEVGSASFDNDSGSFTCSFPDGDALSTISASATDDDGDTGAADTQIVTINNVAPTVMFSALNAQNVNEGSLHTYLYSIFDPGADAITSVLTSCDPPNGVKVVASDNHTNTSGSFQCTFPDGPDTAVLSAAATDDDGDTGPSATQSVTVNNQAPSVPVLNSPANGAITNDNTPTFDWADSSDPAGVNDTITYRIQADGSGCDFTGTLPVDAFVSASTFTPGAGLADGTYCWRVSASDEDGGTSAYSSTRTVMIDATAPNVAITFPAQGGAYSETSWNAGCAAVVGDFCGTASDATSGLLSVQVSMRRMSTGLWWDWNAVTPSFSSATEVFFSVGTAATWNRSFPFANFPATGQYTVHARATDNATNTTDVTSTFQLNRYTIDYLPPLDDSTPTLIVKNTGKNGRVIPVKVDVFLEGVKQTSAHIPAGDLTIGVNLMASCTSDASDSVELYADAGNSNGGTNDFRPSGDSWIYNLDTKALGLVTNKCYRLDVYLDGVKISTQRFAVFQPVK